jgi:hypothetical protein
VAFITEKTHYWWSHVELEPPPTNTRIIVTLKEKTTGSHFVCPMRIATDTKYEGDKKFEGDDYMHTWQPGDWLLLGEQGEQTLASHNKALPEEEHWEPYLWTMWPEAPIHEWEEVATDTPH